MLWWNNSWVQKDIPWDNNFQSIFNSKLETLNYSFWMSILRTHDNVCWCIKVMVHIENMLQVQIWEPRLYE